MIIKSQHNKSLSKHKQEKAQNESKQSSISVVPAVDSVSQTTVIDSSGLQTEKGLLHSNARFDEIVESDTRRQSKPSVSTKPETTPQGFMRSLHPLMQKIGADLKPDTRVPEFYTKVLQKREHIRSQSVANTIKRNAPVAKFDDHTVAYFSLDTDTAQKGDEALKSFLLRNPHTRTLVKAPVRHSSAPRRIVTKLQPRQHFPQASEKLYYGSPNPTT